MCMYTWDKIYPMHPSNYKFALHSWIFPVIKILKMLDNAHLSLANRLLGRVWSICPAYNLVFPLYYKSKNRCIKNHINYLSLFVYLFTYFHRDLLTIDKLQYALGCIATPGKFQSRYALAAISNNSLLKFFAILDNSVLTRINK